MQPSEPASPIIRAILPTEFEELLEMISRMAHTLMLDKYLLIERAEPSEREARKERLQMAIFGKNPQIEVYVLFADEQLAGFCIFHSVFSTYRGQSGMFLQDLYVKDAFQKRGYGKLIMNTLIALAKSRDCHGLSWNVPHDRPFLHQFYNELGGVKDDHWTMYVDFSKST